MGLVVRRTKRIADGTDLNVSKSGASVSRRFGRRLRLNSRPAVASGYCAA